MDFSRTLYIVFILCAFTKCRPAQKEVAETKAAHAQGTFGFDLAFLQNHDDVVVLKKGEALVVVSPKYQGKVFTSSAAGLDGVSFGWINYSAFDSPLNPHINAYGGENRLWLGPEGNRFSLFFPPGEEMSFENWVTPPPIDTEPWTLAENDSTSVSLSKEMSLANYASAKFQILINRKIALIERDDIEKMLGVRLDQSVLSVGYATVNGIVNKGSVEWDRVTGAPCIWILDMFRPSDQTVITVPFNNDHDEDILTTDYFGEVPPDRINIGDSVVLFRADGRSRGKIGASPRGAKPIAASYDPANGILTVVTFDLDRNAVYLNQEWTTEKDPFKGDAVNAYNDGPLSGGSQMGPFYELESVSPAAFLKPGESMTHTHNVFHFTGDQNQLLNIFETLFGPSDEMLKFARGAK